MKKNLVLASFMACTLLASAQAFAQAPVATPAPAAPPAAMPMAKTPTAPMAAPAASAPPATAPSTAPMAAPTAAMPQPGQVWLNTTSKVYHCKGSKYFGNTKVGTYMSVADAKAAGGHPYHGKACTK